MREAYARSSRTSGVLIAVPLFRRPDLARQVVQSLIACEAEVRHISGTVVLINDSPDDEALSASLQDLLPTLKKLFPCEQIVNSTNIGFLRSCNLAFKRAINLNMDLLLLNSDVIITAGALSEMVCVSQLDPMIGFVNPRSNNATLATLPFQQRFRHLDARAARSAWQDVASHLPRSSYVPTAVGFCMLIRWSVIAEFEGFDEIYGEGYNEENDLVMRAGRRGYRAVLANHAFVWHEGQGSFGLKPSAKSLEAKNRALLLARYPEYKDLTEAYFGSPEQRAEFLLGETLPDADGKLDIAFDFSSFAPAHNGTTVAGAQLLSSAAERWRDHFRISVLCSQEAYAFHDYARLGVKRQDPHGEEVYAAVFRVGQPFDWSVVERLVRKGATIGVFMLDTIAIDSAQLYSPGLQDMWTFALEHVDLVATTSELTSAQLDRRFPNIPAARLQSLHSFDLADYILPADAARPSVGEGHLFVIGNHFWHKDVAATVNLLADAYPERQVVVLAGDRDPELPVDDGVHAPRGLEPRPNVIRFQAGTLTSQEMSDLYSDAFAIVFPSHYEGFGMPLLNALASKKPIFVRPLPVFEEMERRLGGDPNIHLFLTTKALVAALRTPPNWIESGASAGQPGDAGRAADDIRRGIEAMVENVSYDRIVRRLRAMQTLNRFADVMTTDLAASLKAEAHALAEAYEASVADAAALVAADAMKAAVPKTPAAFAARYLAQRIELIANRCFEARILLTLARWGARMIRAGRKAATPGRST